MSKAKDVIHDERLIEFLESAPNVYQVEWTTDDEDWNPRVIHFVVGEHTFYIERWVNITYLCADNGLTIPFDNVELAGNMVGEVNQILFFNRSGDVVADLRLLD